MKKSYLVHGLWAVAAVAAFGVGSQFGGSSAGAGEGENGRQLTRFGEDGEGGRLSALAGPGGTGKEGDKAGDDSGFGVPIVVALSDARIAELGETALKDANPLKRRKAFSELLEGMTVDNALAIREQIKALRQDSSEFRDFHYAWGAIAGGDAVLHGMESEERDMAVTLAGWAGSDSAGALAWFNGLSDEERAKSGELKAGMVHGLADGDPMAATNFVFGLGQGGDRQAEGLLRIVTGEMLRSVGAEEASRWSESLPEGELRASAMDSVANRFVAEDPVAAAAWAERFADQPESARVIEEVGDEWAERDPVAAVGWLESLDTGEGKSQGLSSAFSEWVKRDPLAASEHLVAMNDSPERDSAIGGFVRRLAWEDPQSAIAWAGEISDAGEREQTLVRAGQAMFHRDADGAREWLQSSGLSAESQKQVLESGRRGDRRRR